MSRLQANAHKPRLRLIRQGFPERPVFGTAVSEAVLHGVAEGRIAATFRLHRPARELAFAKQDRVAPGFARAVAGAREAGFEPVLRLAGGRAAVFHEGTLAFSWATRDPSPQAGTRERFAAAAGLIAAALGRLGVDARVGEVAGEYCPGAFSVNARGRVKLAGIGQRLISGAAHVGGVVVAEHAELIRAALVPVYEELELDWDPNTAGSVADEAAGTGIDEVEAAIVAELGERFELEPAELDEETLALAERLEAGHTALA